MVQLNMSSLVKRVSLPVMAVIMLIPSPVVPETHHGIDTSYCDFSIDPCADFFQFAVGRWLKETEIAPDQTSCGVWDELHQHNAMRLLQAVEEAVASPTAPGSVERKVADFFTVAMDTLAIDGAGLSALTPVLNRIDAISDPLGLQDELAYLLMIGQATPLAMFSELDPDNSTVNIAYIDQAGLGMPDREYYLKVDSLSTEQRSAYLVHIRRLFELSGDSPAAAVAAANTVLAFETRLARLSRASEYQWDPDSMYNKRSIEELGTLCPEIDWKRYFAALGKHDPGIINVVNAGFLREVGMMIREVPIDDWKVYLRLRLIDDMSNYLSSPFVLERFSFYGKTLSGRQEMAPRWRRVVSHMDNALGDLMSRIYVQRFFPDETKQEIEQLVRNLKDAFRSRIEVNAWIGEPTRREALRKLDAMTFKVGYPERWRDHSALVVGTDSYAQNVFRANEYEMRRQIAKIDTSDDPNEFYMSAASVAEYYDASRNEAVFCAGILQPPFFDPEADEAVNYGAIGHLMGHELTHGFDNSGRMYDADGNLRDWWMPEDARQFEIRETMIREQYSDYIVIDTIRANGDLTVGENIADLGGMMIAYAALKRALANNPAPPLIDGFTAEQRFFLSYAQVWRTKRRPEFMIMLNAIDEHSACHIRTNGVLANMPEFGEAFSCRSGGSLLRPEHKCVVIW